MTAADLRTEDLRLDYGLVLAHIQLSSRPGWNWRGVYKVGWMTLLMAAGPSWNEDCLP